MSFIGGYQSEINLSNLSYTGDLPVERNIGGYGVATGISNAYSVNLNPALGQYRTGMLLAIQFLQANTGASTLNINARGAKPVLKTVGGVLGNLTAGDLSTGKLYLLIYDGSSFQVANSASAVQDATELLKGIAQIATDAEVAAGTDNSKFITPVKLMTYVSSKLSGVWEHRGALDCSSNPLYPEARLGHTFIVSAPGKIGGALGVNVQTRDVVFCGISNTGGTQAAVGNNWTVLQANLEQATEIIAGFARIATQQEALTGTDAQSFITPATLRQVIQSLPASGGTAPANASEVVAGILELATQAETDAGLDDTRAVSPLKLAAYVASKITGLWEDKGLLDCASQPAYPAGLKGDAYTVRTAGKIGGPDGPVVEVRDIIYCEFDNNGGVHAVVGDRWNIIQANLVQATETIAGFSKLASQAEALLGTDSQKIITPATLRMALNSSIAAIPLSTELQAGLIALASYDDTDNESDDFKAVTVAKMAYFVNNRLYIPSLATETVNGIARVASQTEVTTGTSDSLFVTPLKLMTLLNSKIKKMRTQLKFYSPTLPEAECLSGASAGDGFITYISVVGLPAAFQLHQANLVWEGTNRLVDAGHTENAIQAGHLTIDINGQAYPLLSLANKVNLNRLGSSFFRLVSDNILSVLPNVSFRNLPYRVYFSGLNAQRAGLMFTGQWSLELDIEPL